MFSRLASAMGLGSGERPPLWTAPSQDLNVPSIYGERQGERQGERWIAAGAPEEGAPNRGVVVSSGGPLRGGEGSPKLQMFGPNKFASVGKGPEPPLFP